MFREIFARRKEAGDYEDIKKEAESFSAPQFNLIKPSGSDYLGLPRDIHRVIVTIFLVPPNLP